MIKIFSPTDKTFASNGDIVIQPLKSKVHKEDNGEYYCNLETGLEYIDYFVEGNIAVVPTPQGDQAFRIGNVTKNQNKLVSKAYHVFYDSENYLIADTNIVEKTCAEALTLLNNATEPLTEFTVSSNVMHEDSFRCVRKSLYEAFKTVLERWGGHLVRDNFNVSILDSIGQDNGITVQYKKNLKSISCQENWDDVVTKILPVGKDGVLLNAVTPSASIYIESPTQYDLPYTKTVSFSQSIDRGNYSDDTSYLTALVADLRAQAEAYLETHALPEVNYTLKANLDRVTDIGDTILVMDSRLNVSLLTHVIAFDYDAILGLYTSVEFGNFSKTISGLVNSINKTIDSVATEKAQESQAQTETNFAEVVTSPAQRDFALNEYIIFQNELCIVTSPILEGNPIVIGVNVLSVSVGEELNKKISRSDVGNLIYPVGSIYMSVNSTNPATLFGGTWEQLKDRFLLGADATSGVTGGEATHTLTVDEIPAHRHEIEYSTNGTTYSDGILSRSGSISDSSALGGSADKDSSVSFRIKNTGGGQAHNNMPPYITVFMWKRVS